MSPLWGKASRVRNKLVMVVEDEPDIRSFIKVVLEDQGYRVSSASNGLEALQRIGEETPHLVLLDMRMPVMDGWQFSTALRAKFNGRVPVVVVTASLDAECIAREVGAKALLKKPFEIDELLHTVAAYIA